MEWPKLKNIIILILALLNAFLLFLVGGQEVRARRYDRAAISGAAAVLAQNGIAVDTELLKGAGSSLMAQDVRRDIETEAAFARTLLGGVAAAADQGGGLYVYTGVRGSVVFRAGGAVEATFSEYTVQDADLEAFSLALLESLGLQGEVVERSEETVVCRQLLDGTPLFSCCLTFRFDGARLRSIGGTVVLGTAVPDSSGQTLDVPTAMVRFLEGVLGSGDICAAVTGMRSGYRSSQSFDAAVHLAPVWLISTDVSEYYLDSLSGKLSRVQ